MYKVKFFSGYEGKNFIGLSPEEVIRNMTDFEETFYGGKNKEIRRDISKDIIAYYDKKNKICEAIQFVNEHTDIYVNGVQLMRVPEEEVIPTLRKVFPGEEGFTDGSNYMYKYTSADQLVFLPAVLSEIRYRHQGFSTHFHYSYSAAGFLPLF